MPLIIIAAGVALLLILMIGFKVNGFIALVLVAAVVGFAEGMDAQAVLHSIQNGIGSTLGGLAMILGFGAMLGKLISDTGAAQRIATTLIATFGKKRVQWALVITGLVVGLAMFFEVGFVLLLPLVFTIVASSGLPLLYVGVPMVAALSVTHCFLPPHPGPTAIATIFEANLGTTLLYGFIITIPTVIVAGPLFSKLLTRFEKAPPEGLFNPHLFSEEEMPSFWNSIFAAVIPVILMAIAAVCEITLPKTNTVRLFFEFVGNPAVALFIAIVIAIFTLGRRNGRTIEQIMDIIGDSIGAIAMIVFIIAGGGAFKQVLVDSGVGQYISHLMTGNYAFAVIDVLDCRGAVAYRSGVCHRRGHYHRGCGVADYQRYPCRSRFNGTGNWCGQRDRVTRKRPWLLAI